jgi:hypothetical protein
MRVKGVGRSLGSDLGLCALARTARGGGRRLGWDFWGAGEENPDIFLPSCGCWGMFGRRPLKIGTGSSSEKEISMKRHLGFGALAVALVCGIHSAGADVIYVSTSSNQIIKFPDAGGTGTVFASVPGVLSSLGVVLNPRGLAVDGAGNLFVANYSNNMILKFTPAGVPSIFASTGVSGPTGLAFDGAGNLYVANQNSNNIEKFTPGGSGSPFAGFPITLPTGLAFDPAGNLYVAGSGGIKKVTPGGSVSTFNSTVGSSQFQGVATDGAGNVYVGDTSNFSIDEISPGGVSSPFAFVGGANGLAFGSDGSLYAAQQSATSPPNYVIERYSSGTGTVFSSSSLLGGTVLGVATQATPEPGSLALVVVGIVGMLGRRSRRAV